MLTFQPLQGSEGRALMAGGVSKLEAQLAEQKEQLAGKAGPVAGQWVCRSLSRLQYTCRKQRRGRS